MIIEHMKKICLIFIILLYALLFSSCESLERFRKSKNKKVINRKEKTQQPYLKRGVSVHSKNLDSEISVNEASLLSKEELLIQLMNLKRELKKKEEEVKSLKSELMIVKKEYGKKIFELQNKIIANVKEIEDLKQEKLKAQQEAQYAKQKLDSFKMLILQKKSMFDSKYPAFYEVKKGDSLWKISAKKDIYADPYKWVEIYKANRDKIDDPDVIFPGQILKIPRYYEYFFGFSSDNGNIFEEILKEGDEKK